MKNRILLIILLIGCLGVGKAFSQTAKETTVEYKIIAEGTDAPIAKLQVVCFNKYFNQDYLPADFLEKYKLNEKTLYKKKMLVEIFYTDTDKKGFDKIDLVSIKENGAELLIEYNIVNAQADNDDEQLSPFLIVQVPKLKRAVRFIENGIELGKTRRLYVD